MRALAVSLCLCVLAASPASAQQPAIRAAIPEITQGQLWVIGSGFGSTPLVTIGGLIAAVFHISDDAIGVTVPPAVLGQPGSYELTVASSVSAMASFNVTIPSASTLKPMMVDAAGRIIGPMVEAPFYANPVSARVLVTGNGLLATVYVARIGFYGQESPVFESEDCTGMPFLKAEFLSGEQILPSSTVTADGFLHALDQGVPPSRPALRSALPFSGNCTPYTGPWELHSPTLRILDLKQFTPPFRLELR